MPIEALEFWSIIIAYLMALILPVIGIRAISRGLEQIRNKFDVISAILVYPGLFVGWKLLTVILDKGIGKGAVSLYVSLVIVLSIVLAAVLVAKRKIVK